MIVTYGKDESAAKDTRHHHKYSTAKHDQQPSFLPRIDLRTPKQLRIVSSGFLQVLLQLILYRLTGRGIDKRYASVQTFKTTVKNKSIFEIAGWQWSFFLKKIRTLQSNLGL